MSRRKLQKMRRVDRWVMAGELRSCLLRSLCKRVGADPLPPASQRQPWMLLICSGKIWGAKLTYGQSALSLLNCIFDSQLAVPQARDLGSTLRPFTLDVILWCIESLLHVTVCYSRLGVMSIWQLYKKRSRKRSGLNPSSLHHGLIIFQFERHLIWCCLMFLWRARRG